MDAQPQSVNVLILVPGMVMAASMVWIGLIGFLSGSRVGYVNVLFACVFAVVAWYFTWISFVLADVITYPSPLLGLPMLTAGFIGPVGWLFIKSVLDPQARFRRWHLLALSPALFGVGVAVYTLAYPERVWPIWTEFLSGHFVWTTTPVTVLFALHGIQSLLFSISALLIAVRAFRQETDPRRRVLTFHVMGVASGALAAAFISAFLPLAVAARTAQAITPSLMLPTLAVAYYALRSNRRMLLALEEQRRHMSRYLPAQLVNVLTEGSPDKLAPQEAHVTVLFSDIRGFTTLNEKHPPGEIVNLLNDYFGVMTQVVFQHDGMLNKFIGDAVLAVFGVPAAEDKNHSESAVACALHMFEALRPVNERWTALGREPVKIGIGLHCGKVTHGNVGTGPRMEYTVIGDVVNAASRIEGLCKEAGVPLLFSAEVVRHMGDTDLKLRSLGEWTLRGRSQTVELFTVDQHVQVHAGRPDAVVERSASND